MPQDTERSTPKQEWYLELPLWLDLVLFVLLIIILFGGPFAASRWVHPWVGAILAVLAIPAWLVLGPRPMPGFLPGMLAVNVFLILVALFLRAVVHALRVAVAG